MTEPNGAAGADPNAAADPNAQPAAEPAAAEPGAAATRPEFIPEKFWDEEKGEARLEAAFKSYGELEQERLARTKRVPEDYTLPEAWSGLPDDAIDHEVFGEIKELAKAEGYSQQGFEALLSALCGDPGTHMDALKQEFGDELEPTLEACRMYARTFGEHEDVVRQLTSTAAGVKFLNDMRLKSGEQPLPGQPGQGAPKVTQEELNSKMRDPRYWREKDPAFIAEVTRGFQELYGAGQVRTAAVNPGEQPGTPV